MKAAFNTEFTRYSDIEKKKGFIDKNGRCTNWYRIHWAGDIPNTNYAKALAQSMKENDHIDFWTYTRTFEVLKYFADLTNCILYVSADADNIHKAEAAYEPYKDNPRIGWCYLSKEKPAGQGLQDCLVDSGQLKLEGACHECRRCLQGKPIWFKQK